MTRLAAEKLIPEFHEKIAEVEGGAILREGWGEILCGHWVKPVGNTDGDQAEAETTTVPHRTENVPFSTVKVFVYTTNDCAV